MAKRTSKARRISGLTYVDGFVVREKVVFAWVVYKSRQDRDRVNAKAMKDTRLAAMMNPKAMPFDGKRMFWGGFKILVNA